MAEAAPGVADLAGEELIEAMFDPSKKKKKKTKAKKDDEETGAGADAKPDAAAASAAAAVAPDAGAGSAAVAGGAASSGAAPAAVPVLGSVLLGGDGAEISYEDMLAAIFGLLHANNPDLTERTRKKLKPPQVMRVGTTRTAWVNFKEMCDMLKRDADHIQSFFLAELGTTGSVDGNDRFLMKGKYQPKYVETLLRKYIAEYVTCAMCKSLDTELTRDPISRLYFTTCKACGSQRSVAAIKAGYHATGKGERRKARDAEG